MTFDPIEVVYKILDENYDWDSLGVRLRREYEVKAIDLRAGSYVIVGSVRESDAFLGLGAREYMRNVRVRIQIRTGEGREFARKIVNIIRDIFRNRSNWIVDGIHHMNFLIDTLADRSDMERRIFTHILEVRWLVVESVY